MNKVTQAQFGTLTVVDARGARRNQASNILRDGVIFDSSVLLQFKGTLYKGITEHRGVNRVRYMMTSIFVSLTGQRCNHFWRWCGHVRRSANAKPVN
jgi:hypothetical protein